MTDRPADRHDKPPRRRLRRLRRTMAALLWCGFLFVLAVMFTPLELVLARPLIASEPPCKAEFIVVLGGHTERSVEAANLFRLGFAPKIIVSSGPVSAENLANVLVGYGVPREAIVLDTAARRTADHPRTILSAPGVTRQSSLLIVTSALHTGRAKACFVHDGYTNIHITSPQWRAGGQYSPENTNWLGYREDWIGVLYDWAAMGMYKARGWI